MTDLIQIDYKVLAYMIVGVFGLVGFFRGWWKEAITTGLLTLLLLMLKVPSIATVIVQIMDRIVNSVWAFIQSLQQSSGPVASAAASVGPPPNVDPQRYWIYVITLVVLVIASYFIGKIGLTQGLSAGARLLGAIAGFYNGFVAISLVREFVIGRFLPGAPAFAATATPPSTVSVQVVNMPQSSIADAPTVFFLIGIGFLLFLIAIGTAVKFEKVKISRKAPPLYKGPPAKPRTPGFDVEIRPR
jgi:hypothetical protein